MNACFTGKPLFVFYLYFDPHFLLYFLETHASKSVFECFLKFLWALNIFWYEICEFFCEYFHSYLMKNFEKHPTIGVNFGKNLALSYLSSPFFLQLYNNSIIYDYEKYFRLTDFFKWKFWLFNWNFLFCTLLVTIFTCELLFCS